MTSPSGQKLLTELLSLESVRVTKHDVLEGIGLVFHVESKRNTAVCNRCGKESEKLHQNHYYLVKDLPISGQAVYLRVNRRQFKCKNCKKPFSEELEYLKSRRKYTKRLAKEIVKQALADDVKSVADTSDVSIEEIETMLSDAAQEIKEKKPSEIRSLGIDEIALVKGQGNYCAVLVDIEKKKLVAILESRTKKAIAQELKSWGEWTLAQIEYVSIDLWSGYRNLVEEMMPNAVVVADRFHVMKLINEELDQQRKTQKRAALKDKNKSKTEEILSGLAKSKYPLLKNESSLTEAQKEKLKQVKQVCPVLGKMHEWKEEFRRIFEDSQDWVTGILKLADWLCNAPNYYPQSKKTIIRWIGEIVSYFDERISSGVVEGINNKLKLIKRSAYGMRNFNNFRTRCLLSWHS